MRRLFILFSEQWIVGGFFLVTAAVVIGVGSWRTGGSISTVEIVDGEVVRFAGKYVYGEENRLVVVVKLKNGVVWQIEDPRRVSRNCEVGGFVKIRVVYRDSGPLSREIVNNGCKPSPPNNG